MGGWLPMELWPTRAIWKRRSERASEGNLKQVQFVPSRHGDTVQQQFDRKKIVEILISLMSSFRKQTTVVRERWRVTPQSLLSPLPLSRQSHVVYIIFLSVRWVRFIDRKWHAVFHYKIFFHCGMLYTYTFCTFSHVEEDWLRRSEYNNTTATTTTRAHQQHNNESNFE